MCRQLECLDSDVGFGHLPHYRETEHCAPGTSGVEEKSAPVWRDGSFEDEDKSTLKGRAEEIWTMIGQHRDI